MLVLNHVSAVLVAPFHRADVPTRYRPAADRTPYAPSTSARWLRVLHNVMLSVLVATTLIGSGWLPPTTRINVRPARLLATLVGAARVLGAGQQVLGQLPGAAPHTGTAFVAFGRVGASMRYRTYVPLVRTLPRSTTPASIDLSKYPTEYTAYNGYVYTGRRAQVLHHMQEQFSTRVTTYADHSECATCSADIWTPDARGGVDNTALPNMNAMAEYFRANRSVLGIKYVIWNQRISMGGAWQDMEDRGSITANHKDHVHITFADSFR